MIPIHAKCGLRFRWYFVTIATLGCSNATDAGTARKTSAMIYSTDSRREYGEIQSTSDQWLADATGLVLNRSSLVGCSSGSVGSGGNVAFGGSPASGAGGATSTNGGGGASGATCTLRTNPWTAENSTPLCSAVRFRAQPSTGGLCSAVLVGPALVATRKDCVTILNFSLMRVVFGYNADANGANAPASIPEQDVYRVVAGRDDDAGWSLLSLDRAVNRPIMNVRYAGEVGLGTPVTMIGFPSGIPLKIATGGAQTGDSSGTFFHTVDWAGHADGAPIFNSETRVLEGLHSRSSSQEFVSVSDGSGGQCLQEPICTVLGCADRALAISSTGFASKVPLPPSVILAAAN